MSTVPAEGHQNTVFSTAFVSVIFGIAPAIIAFLLFIGTIVRVLSGVHGNEIPTIVNASWMVMLGTAALSVAVGANPTKVLGSELGFLIALAVWLLVAACFALFAA